MPSRTKMKLNRKVLLPSRLPSHRQRGRTTGAARPRRWMRKTRMKVLDRESHFQSVSETVQ